MPISIGSNISSLVAQRRLGEATSTLERTYERLSSGMRINRASDDAAGLAVSQSLNTQARVYSRSILNVNDHLSAIQIASGAAGQITNALTRMIELSEQAANGVYGNPQRSALENEANALKNEINRIIESTTFQGRLLLDGNYTNSRVQLGDTTSNLFVSISSITGTLKPNGTFAAGVSFGSANGEADHVATADFNGDGILDTALTSSTLAGGLIMMLGNGDGTFQAGITIGNGGSGVVAVDFDQDGDQDLLTNTFSNGNVFVYLNNGNGTFGSSVTYVSGLTLGSADSSRLKVGDMNGDGKLDIVLGSQSLASMAILYGNGNGTLQAGVTYALSTNPRVLDLGDIDGDGDLDIVGVSAGGLFQTIRNNGGGSFTSSNYAATTNGRDLRLSDLNGDGNLDYLIADAAGLYVGLGNGDGTFGAAANVRSGNYQGVAIKDINDDGVLDLVGAANGYITTSFGNGNGTFRAGASYAAHASTNDLIIADFDKDGLNEILTAGGTSGQAGQLSFFEALGTAGVAGVDFSTIASARDALDRLRSTLQSTSSNVGSIGAMEARLGIAKKVLEITRENYLAAQSRIQDADIAEETATLVRTQILQKIGASILGQANLAPQIALKLLKG